MGEAIFGSNFVPAFMDRKIEALSGFFKETPFVIVWDNFESARGIEGTPQEPMLSAADQQLLRTFLKKLRDGRTKVIITSRSSEDWLETTNRFKVSIGGLHDEERWEYCQVILRDLGITIDHKDPELVELMDVLDGHPLMMRAVLPKLEDRTAASIVAALKTNLKELGLKGDETQDNVKATLRFVEQSLPQELRPLLLPLAMHERYVDVDYLEQMAREVDAAWTRDWIERFVAVLEVAGLMRDRGQAIYELHPALTGFLRSMHGGAAGEKARDPWARVFVDVMGTLADRLAPRPLHEQRFPFHIHGTSFYHALREAERLAMETDFVALAQALASYAQNVRNFKTAEELFRKLADFHAARKKYKGQASAYHQLGIIAEERRDFDAAEAWYQKSLAIEEKQGNEHGAAITYGQLGIIAGLQERYEKSGRWLIKCIVAFERQGDPTGAERNLQNFLIFYSRSTAGEQEKLKGMWEEAGLALQDFDKM